MANSSTLIIYGSTYGYTERYTEWIKEQLEAEGYSVVTAPITEVTDEQIEAAQTVVIGASYYGGLFLTGAPSLRKKAELLKNKNLVFFTVSFNGTVANNGKMLDGKVLKSFTEDLASGKPTFHLRGGINHDVLSATHKTVLQGVRMAMKMKPNKNEANQQILDSYATHSADFMDRANVEPIVAAVKAYDA